MFFLLLLLFNQPYEFLNLPRNFYGWKFNLVHLQGGILLRPVRLYHLICRPYTGHCPHILFPQSK